MIISHKYKYIFIKTNKTAGTSIELALSKFCGPDDIITPVSTEDEITRKKLGFPGSQNYQIQSGNNTAILTSQMEKQAAFYNHISATEIKAHIGQHMWDNYYKFCFVRNPWERVISRYYWIHQTEPRPTLSEFIESNEILKHKYKSLRLYTIDGRIAVNRVCRYENLDKELEAIRQHLGMPEKLDLPRAKSKYRKDKREYHEILDEKQQARIAEIFSDEIRLFGY